MIVFSYCVVWVNEKETVTCAYPFSVLMVVESDFVRGLQTFDQVENFGIGFDFYFWSCDVIYAGGGLFPGCETGHRV